MPLYAVQIERTIVLEAASESDALLDFYEYERQDAENPPEGLICTEVQQLEDVPSAWWNAIPYGTDGDKTVADLVPSAQGKKGDDRE